jgi:alpha-beta hydrolase superfamily lysophospholipase
VNNWWIAAAAAGLAGVPLAAVSLIAWKSFTPPRSDGEIPADIVRDRLEAVTFLSGGRTLQAWIYRPSGDPRGVVLLAHGWGSTAANMLNWSRFLAEAGWASLAFDMRGHGKSEGGDSMSLPRLTEDIDQASAFVDSRADLARLPRAVLGHSMGGAAVLLALSRGLPVQAAIITSSFARVETATDYVLRKRLLPPVIFRKVVKGVWSLRLGRGMGAYEPERTIRDVKVPLLLAHGTEDPTVPMRELRRLEASADARLTEVLLVPGAAHSNLTEFPAYGEGVLRFLAAQLAAQPAGQPAGQRGLYPRENAK